MSKRAKKTKKKEEQFQTILPMAEVMKAELFDMVVLFGIEQVAEIFEKERERICGPRYCNDSSRIAYRAGHVDTALPLGGRMVTVSRPRVRSKDGKKEIPLESVEMLRTSDPLTRRMMEQMVIGVSTRNYTRSLEPVPEKLNSRGTSKSSVSRAFVASTQKKTNQFLKRELSSVAPVIIMIDGVHFGDHVILVALGVNSNGDKSVLGIQEGATENSVSCKRLLEDIVSRGVSQEGCTLFVLDGSKALVKAVRALWGERALIQRCQEHKRRNVLEQLPKHMQHSVKISMNQAYSSKTVSRAKKLLKNLANRLKNEHPGAEGSLKEGLEETLTVIELGITGDLRKFLSTTNAIENLIGTVRRISKRVKRWRNGAMLERWTASGLLEAEKGFRKIRGYKGLPKLVSALKAKEKKLGILNDEIDTIRATG